MLDSYDILLAPNHSLLTGPGTNTIVLGGGIEGATVIDPADEDMRHLEAIIQAGHLRGGLRRILITHGHPDHTGGALQLRSHLQISIYGFSREGISIIDEEISEGTIIPAGEDALRALHTPGHRFDHLSFFLEKHQTLFAGDLISSAGSVVIPSYPEGNMSDYLDSLQRLQKMNITEIVPAHGSIILNPQEKLADYITHRLEREQQIIARLQTFPHGIDISTLVEQIYTTTDPRLYPLAAQSVMAHLQKLEREGRAIYQQEPGGWFLR